MTNCRVQRQRILRAADHELALEERLSLDAHIAGCPHCRSYQAQLQQLEEAVEQLAEPPVERLDVQRARRDILAAIDAAPVDESPRAAVLFPAEERLRVNERSASRILAAGWSFRWQLATLIPAAGFLVFVLSTSEPLPPEQVVELPANGSQVAEVPPSPGTPVEAESPRREALDMQLWLRSALLTAFATESDELDVDACLERFDAAAGVAYLRWPLERMAEGCLDSAEPELARAAARFLGRRGDRISASHLGIALERARSASPRASRSGSRVARACVLALGDLGAPGVGALAAVLEDSDLMPLALEQLARAGTATAAESIGGSLTRLWDRGARGTDERVRAHLAALARVGPPSVPVFLALAHEGHLDRELALGWLESVPAAGAELVRSLGAERLLASAAGVQLLLDAVARVQPPAALPWIEELATEYEHRGRALACLQSWTGSAPVAALMRIAAQGSVSSDELVKSLRQMAAGDGERLSEYARVLVSTGDALAAGPYLELLVESAHPSGALALAELAAADLMTADDRLWAALAVGELAYAVGENSTCAEAAELLASVCGSFEFGERRLMAACLLIIHQFQGTAGVRAALGAFPEPNVGRVCRALDAMDADGESPGDKQNTTRVFRIARVLGNSLLSRDALVATSSS